MSFALLTRLPENTNLLREQEAWKCSATVFVNLLDPQDCSVHFFHVSIPHYRQELDSGSQRVDHDGISGF